MLKKSKKFKISTDFLLEKFFTLEKLFAYKDIPPRRFKIEEKGFLYKIIFESLIYHNNFITKLLGNEKKVIQIIELNSVLGKKRHIILFVKDDLFFYTRNLWNFKRLKNFELQELEYFSLK